MPLYEHLSIIKDPRSPINREHDIIFLVMSATASGCESWLEIEEFGIEHIDWLREHRSFASGIPTRHSIARIIKAVNVESLVLVMFSWVNSLHEKNGKQLIAKASDRRRFQTSLGQRWGRYSPI